MTFDSSKFLVVNGYAILRSTIAETLPDGVRLHDGRVFTSSN